MNTKAFRIVLNSVVMLALALGLMPITPTAARLAPEPPDPKGFANSSGLTAPAAPAAIPQTLKVAERLRLASVENGLGPAAIDAVNGYGYFASDLYGVIVKVRLADHTRVGHIGLWYDEGNIKDMVADPTHGFLYVIAQGALESYNPLTRYIRIVRVRLADFKRDSVVSIPVLPHPITNDYRLYAGLMLDPAHEFAYFSYRDKTGGWLVKLHLPDLTVVGRAPMQDYPTFDNQNAWAIDAARGIAYIPGRIVHLADMTITSVPTLTNNTVYDVAQGLAYVGAGSNVTKIRLADMTQVGQLSFNSDDGSIVNALIAPDLDFAAFLVNSCTTTAVSKFIKVRLSDFTRTTQEWVDSGDVCGNYPPYPIINPVTGVIYGSNPQVAYKTFTLRAWWQLVGVPQTLQLNDVDESIAQAYHSPAYDGMLSLAHDRLYFLGYATLHDSGFQYSCDYPIISQVRLSDFTRAGAKIQAGGQMCNPNDSWIYWQLGGAIDTAAGDLYAAHRADQFYGSTWLEVNKYHLPDFTYEPIAHTPPTYFKTYRVHLDPAAQMVFIDRVSVINYQDVYSFTAWNLQTGVYTDAASSSNGYGVLAVDTAHGYLYRRVNNNTLYKVRAADLSVAGVLTMPVSLMALDPAADTGYLLGSYDYPTFALSKVRLSDFTFVMSTTTSAYGDLFVLDPAAGYGYVVGSQVYQVRLADLAVTDSSENLWIGPVAAALDPVNGYLYVGGGNQVVKLGVSAGKSVTPESNVPYHGLVTYTLNLAGHMTITDTNVVLTDTLPPQVDFVGWVAQPAGATASNDVIHWSGTLNPKQVITFTFTAQHVGDYSDVVLNTAEYSGTVVHRVMRATFEVEPPPPVLLNKAVTPTQAAPGDAITYTLRFFNSAFTTTTGLVLTDVLPLPVSNPHITASVPFTVHGGTQYVLDLADLPMLEGGLITITGHLAGDTPGGPLTNTATLAGLTSGTVRHVSANAVLTVTGTPQTPKLAIGKTAVELSDPPLLVNDQILYTIRVTNTSTATLSSLRITDTLPAGVTYLSIPKGAPSAIQTGPVVVWTQASLAAGAVREFKVIGKATGNPTPIGANCAAAISAESPAPVSACANVPDPNVQQALELLKDAVDLNGPPLLVNDVIRYTIYITNASSSVTLTNVYVTDTLPAGTVLVSATQPYTGTSTLYWRLGALGPGDTWMGVLDERVDGTANPIGANVAAVCADQQSCQDTGDVYPPDPVIQTALRVGKTALEYQNDPPLLENDQIVYTIRVTNTTTGTLTSLRITDTLPAGVAFLDVPKAYRPYTRNGAQVVWARPSLAAGASLTLQVIGKVDGSANPIGWNHVAAVCAEETTPAAATAQVPGDGIHEPGLVITGTGGGGLQALAVLGVGDLFTYTLTVRNANASLTMHALVVTLTVPSGAELVSATPGGYTGTALLRLVWQQPTFAPGAVWNGQMVVRQTGGALGALTAAARSAEQSPLELSLGQAARRIYLPLVIRNN